MGHKQHCRHNMRILHFQGTLIEEPMSIFCQAHNLEHLIKEFTCFQSHKKPTTIGLVLTNKPKKIANKCTFETDISNFHKFTLSVLKTLCKKQNPREVSYQNYKNFNNRPSLKDHLKLNLEKSNTSQFSLKDFQNS